jgi:hypothetical protein
MSVMLFRPFRSRLDLAWTDADSGNFPDSNSAEEVWPFRSKPLDLQPTRPGRYVSQALVGGPQTWTGARPELVGGIRGATKVVVPSCATSPVVTA